MIDEAVETEPTQATSGFSYDLPVSDVSKSAQVLLLSILKKYWALVCLGLLVWASLTFFVILPLENTDGAWPGIIIALPFIVLLLLYGIARSMIETIFWQQFAKKHDLSYTPAADYSKEKAFMFDQGHSESITHFLSGTIGNHPLRIFSYTFTTGSGKHKQTHLYTVFGFTFNGRFPHFYLDYKKDWFNRSIGEKISLPEEFEKKFALYAPRKYEIEAHQIFSPDLLAYLLDHNLKYDIEIVNQELLVFISGQIGNLADLENELAEAQKLMEKIAPTLDNFHFEKIGDYSPALSLD